MIFSKPERQAWIQQITKFFREHWVAVAKLGMYILLCAYFLASRSEPAELAVKQVLSLVQTFGLIAVLWGSWSSDSQRLPRFMSRLVYYSMALWLIGNSGDSLYRWVLANPNDVAISASAFAIVWMIVRSGGKPKNGSEVIARTSSASAMASSTIVPKPTDRDKRYSAAHEAGHALIYAALGRLPHEVKAAVNDHSDQNGVLGFVTGIRSPHQLNEKIFAEWHMLVFLAGKMGEMRLTGESTLGSTDDYARWLNLARQYLSNHYRGMYYPEPQNEFEQSLNEKKLTDLQADQLAALTRLFDQNACVFKELADALLEKGKLGCDELISFLTKVELPEIFPLPFGPFKTFSTEWNSA